MSKQALDLSRYLRALGDSSLAGWSNLPPWELTGGSSTIVRELLARLRGVDFDVSDEVAVHRSATVETGAVLKGPLILGAGCLVAAGAYLRGGNWVGERCTLGPGTELKSSFVFAGTSLAHFNFVGDSILGEDVNLEAGSIVCNARNERADREIRAVIDGKPYRIGCEKFGALIGDGCRIGANAVLAPGTLLAPNTIVARASLCDQEMSRRRPNGRKAAVAQS